MPRSRLRKPLFTPLFTAPSMPRLICPCEADDLRKEGPTSDALRLRSAFGTVSGPSSELPISEREARAMAAAVGLAREMEELVSGGCAHTGGANPCRTVGEQHGRLRRRCRHRRSARRRRSLFKLYRAWVNTGRLRRWYPWLAEQPPPTPRASPASTGRPCESCLVQECHGCFRRLSDRQPSCSVAY